MGSMRKYGVPYKGSKSKLADWIIDLLPPADTVVDLFAGGCAIMHAALLSGKWNHIICNDADPRGIRLFLDSIHGRYTVENHPEWISRETFNLLKESDPYVAICWSFGNNLRDYQYGEEIEAYKKSIWDLCHADTVYSRKLKYRQCSIRLAEVINRRLIWWYVCGINVGQTWSKSWENGRILQRRREPAMLEISRFYDNMVRVDP